MVIYKQEDETVSVYLKLYHQYNNFPSLALSVVYERRVRRSLDTFVFPAMGNYTLLAFRELRRETAQIPMTERYI